MTTEQKAKAYDEALKEAKRMYNSTWYRGYNNADLENLFPELKESEDEKIRDEICTYIGARQDISLNTHNRWLDWLEKQGEQNNSDIKDYNSIDPHFGKPTDKFEPKFHKGDWIVREGVGIYKVVEVCESRYEVVDDKDKHYSIDFYEENMCHLWTIEDAKDGDVLVDEDNNIGIYKEIGGNDWDSYIYLGCDGRLRFSIGGRHEQTDTHSATKEQRDLLFQKMKEAGYEWNAELKELRKFPTPADVGFAELGKDWEEEADIEEVNGEDYGIDGLYHAQRILEKTLGEVDGYQSDDGILDHKAAITAVKKIYEHKPTWSEEDEKILHNIEQCIYDNVVNIGSVNKVRYVDWLKSLRPQKQWKPSEEQLKFLQHYADQNNYDGTVLTSLLNDLKKL